MRFCALLLAAAFSLPATAAPHDLPWHVAGLSDEALATALAAWECAVAKGDTRDDVLAVIDWSLPSTEKRLWILDPATGAVLFHEWVAHGQRSGDDRTTSFSNVPESRASNLGVLRAAEVYTGKHGKSLRLDGLEPGVNDNARERAIVIHGADYVSEAFIAAEGRLGRSWGCPAVRSEVASDVIDTLKDGALLVAYYPDPGWLASSPWLSCPAG